MSELVEFLLARIAEDEHVGRTADIGRGSGTGLWELWTITNPARGEVRATPTRVLAECEAKRRIIDRYPRLAEGWVENGQGDLEVAEDEIRLVLLQLAQPYAGHPHFHPSWLLENEPG